jgi:hypothetical protein
VVNSDRGESGSRAQVGDPNLERLDTYISVVRRESDVL